MDWYDAKGFEDYIQVTKCGRVRTKYKEVIYFPYGKKRVLKCLPRELKTSNDSKGALTVWFTYKKKNQSKRVHRLVAETFLPNPLNKKQVNHKDGNRENNNVDNLEWATQEENMNHAKINGLTNQPKINWETTKKIQKIYKEGKYNQYELAEMFGCSQSNICNVLKRKEL